MVEPYLRIELRLRYGSEGRWYVERNSIPRRHFKVVKVGAQPQPCFVLGEIAEGCRMLIKAGDGLSCTDASLNQG